MLDGQMDILSHRADVQWSSIAKGEKERYYKQNNHKTLIKYIFYI